MELKPGSIQGLIRDNIYTNTPSFADSLLHQMLQALDYLSFSGVIHRDVKPENILYSSCSNNTYIYQLADFGLANAILDARTYAGSGMYMAPELDLNPGGEQTPKMDIWSLFVTLAFAMNVGGFRGKPLHTTSLKIKAVQDAADEEIFRQIRDMAVVDPGHRYTAAALLDRLFNGEGRTTPRSQPQDATSAERAPWETDNGPERENRSEKPAASQAPRRLKPGTSTANIGKRSKLASDRVKKRPPAHNRPI